MMRKIKHVCYVEALLQVLQVRAESRSHDRHLSVQREGGEGGGHGDPDLQNMEAEPRMAACVTEKVRASGGIKEVGVVCESGPGV